MQINNDDEIQLIKSLQSEIKNDAFRELVSPYLNYCFVIINRIVDNKTESEDILQETLIQVLNNISKFRFESSFKTWIAKIAYNQALQFLRKNKEKYKLSLESVGEEVDAHYDLEEDTFKSFKKELIWEAVEKLSGSNKTVLLFFYKDELSIKEICEIQDRTENQVKVQLHRARAELKKILEKLM